MLTAIFTRELFRNDKNTTAIFKALEGKREYRCSGPMPALIKGVRYDLGVERIKAMGYGGEEYQISECRISNSNSKENVIRLLSSGMFRGIGKTTAEQIYELFGSDTFDVIEHEAYRLTEIKGITKDKAWAIYKSYLAHTMETRMYKYLAPYGFNARQASEAVKISPISDALEYIQAAPYSLTKIRGVSFEMADFVAKANNVPETDINRLASAAEQILKDEMNKGNAAATFEELSLPLIKLLNTSRINEHNIGSYIKELIREERLSYRKVKKEDGEILFYIYLPNILKAEQYLKSLIEAFLSDPGKNSAEQVKEHLIKEEKKKGIILDASQKQAIVNALTNNISIVTGGPGTGKTTVIDIICRIWDRLQGNGRNIVLMAPTGRAARKMAEATERLAGTIHSTLRFEVSEDRESAQDNKEIIENSLVVIDECSMLDMFLARDVFERLDGCTLVLIGDADQLPSVGCGRVLADLIRSKRIPCSKLEYVHRQKEGSLICENAQRVNNGISRLKAGKSFSINLQRPEYNGRSEESLLVMENKMISEYLRLIDRYGRDNVAILCPFNEHYTGQKSVNIRLQEKLNPFSKGIKEFKTESGQTVRIGDPIMQLVNKDGVMNGEVGRAVAIDKVDGKDILSVKYDDRLLEYDKTMSSDISLAYAMTVHKSQGSEYDAVVTCLSDFHGPMLRRNILYTAITRGKKEVSLIGTKSAIETAIVNNQAEERNTLLWYDLAEKGRIRMPNADNNNRQLTLVI